MKKTIIVMLILVAIVAFANPAIAATYSINGTVNRTDNNTRIVGATVFNGTNTTTTDADGAWGLFNMQNNTGSIGWRITYRAPGFVEHQNNTNVSGANNITNNVSLTPITPTQSSVASSSVTKYAGVISWTVTATDNIDNNYVANRVRYSKDSALVNNVFYTSFSNNTVSPSFALSGMELNTKYYYSADTSNIATGAYSASTTGSFTTTKGNYSDDDEIQQTVAKPKATAQSKKSVTKMVVPRNNNQVFFLMIVIILGGAYFVIKNEGKKNKGNKGKKKN